MAKEIQLTKDQVAVVDECDWDYLNKFSWRCQKAQGNRLHDLSYAMCSISVGNKKQVVIPMHRLVIARVENDPVFLVSTNLYVDHANHNGLDNRRCNLRRCSNTENQINKRVQRNNTTGFKGVTQQGKKFVVRFTAPGRGRVFGGTFSDPKEAARKYNSMAVELFGKFALLNEV